MEEVNRKRRRKNSGAIRLDRAYFAVRHFFQKMISRIKGQTFYGHKYFNTILSQALEGLNQQSDISDHLGAIFYFTMDAAPGLIVELGTREGESTRALLAAAFITNSTLLSIDVDDCSQISVPFCEHWQFVKADDVDFAGTPFRDWCRDFAFKPVIDVLFIDTSHEYEHTKKELEVWSKYLSEQATIILHDTNMGEGIYTRNDGSTGVGWNNQRGVMRALEEFVGRRYDEKSFFFDVTDTFSLIHFPNCNGLMVVKKMGNNA